MNFPFYKKIQEQADLQDLLKSIHPAMQLLENLQIKLSNLSTTDLKNSNFSEIAEKVERLATKLLPNLVEDYCKLTLEYRNTAVIKHENIQGKKQGYTSKDIFLQNFSKLIEEIHILENQFNHHYSNKLLVQSHIVKELGVQKNIIETETEYENVKPISLKSDFNYEIFKKSEPSVKKHKKNRNKSKENTVEDTPQYNEDEWNPDAPDEDNVQSKKKFSPMEEKVMAVVMAVVLVGVGVLTFTEDRTPLRVSSTVESFVTLKEDIQSHYKPTPNNLNRYTEVSFKNIKEKSDLGTTISDYATSNNSFGGKMIVMPETIQSANDGFSIAATGIPKNACSNLVGEVINLTKEVVTVNSEVVSQGGKMNNNSVNQACSLDSNTIKIISK